MKQKGFTLIELIIVVAIFAIVGTIAAGNGLSFGEQFLRGSTICKYGVLWNIDGRGNQTQVFGTNPATGQLVPASCQ